MWYGTLILNMFAAASPTNTASMLNPTTTLRKPSRWFAENRYEHFHTVKSIYQHVLRCSVFVQSVNDPAENVSLSKMQSKGSRLTSLRSRLSTPHLCLSRSSWNLAKSSQDGALCFANTSGDCCGKSRGPPPTTQCQQSQNPEDYCVPHLSSITDAALEGMQDDYDTPYHLITWIYQVIVRGDYSSAAFGGWSGGTASAFVKNRRTMFQGVKCCQRRERWNLSLRIRTKSRRRPRR
jgi:hypothetical protein